MSRDPAEPLTLVQILAGRWGGRRLPAAQPRSRPGPFLPANCSSFGEHAGLDWGAPGAVRSSPPRSCPIGVPRRSQRARSTPILDARKPSRRLHHPKQMNTRPQHKLRASTRREPSCTDRVWATRVRASSESDDVRRVRLRECRARRGGAARHRPHGVRSRPLDHIPISRRP
jgi:hypothetical protein